METLELEREDGAEIGVRPVIDLMPGLGAKEIDRELRLADRQTDAGNRRLAFYLADMEERGICQMLGFPTATAYAVKRLEMGRRHAQELIATGRALEELPKIDDAFCEGKLNWSRVRLLTKIAVTQTEAEWLDRALVLAWADFEREVLTSEKGRPPRKGRKGLPQVKIGVKAKLDRLTYEQWELAKRKLAEELGEPVVTDADFMGAAAMLMLGTKRDGTVKGRERLDDSNFRIVIDRCSDCHMAYLQTLEGPAEIAKPVFEMIACDAKVEVIRDEEPRKRGEPREPKPSSPDSAHDHEHPPPTPAWMRTKVLIRDGYTCKICGGTRDVQAHHVVWRSTNGPTRPSNLLCLCTRCHALVHDNLVFIRGEAPHALEITDAEGERLGRSPKSIGIRLRYLRRAARISEAVLAGAPPAVDLTFGALPSTADALWLSRHAHLFTWKDSRGEMVFESGSPVEQSEGPQDARKPVLDGDGQPLTLGSLIGQERVVATLQVAIDAAKIRGEPLDHILLLGEAGLGKTTLARAVANELGCRVATTSGPLIKDASVLIRILAGLASGQVLFIDEIHGLPRSVAESLYEAMEDGVLRLPVTDGHRSKTIEIRLNPFTLIGATTELGKVPGPFQSRFTIREHLDAFSPQELAKIGVRAIVRTPLEIDPDAALLIGGLAHGVPREMVKLSKRISDLALAKRVSRIDQAFVRIAREAYGIDERGLGTIEQKALRVLERNGRGRPMGIARWVAASGLCGSVLRQVCEPALLRLGLIAVTPRGRMAVA